MRSQRIDVAGIRREQIVEAAVAVITEQGLQNLSLSEIEKKAAMSRGQLTYYFPSKEEILLAVFDRLVVLMYQRIGTPDGPSDQHGGWDWIEHLFQKLLRQPPVSPEFGCLQYTFLSQIGHRKDFRERLATLYEEWRTNMSLGLSEDMVKHPAVRPVSPRALATLVQALLHGLAMQRAADPSAFDQAEMLELCLELLSTFLWNEPRAQVKRKPAAKKKSVATLSAKAQRLVSPGASKGVNGERTHG
jgi:AcrR family transcriptional regulator